MGRPIKKKYFGNTNLGSASTRADNFIGGEGIASIVVTNTATNAGYSTSTAVTWVASAPTLPGGVAATGTAVVWFNGGQGRLQSLSVTEKGSGYTSTSSITITYTPARSGGVAATTQATLAATQQNAISITSYLTTGSSAVSGGDIIKQEASRRYLVRNSQGIGQVRIGAGTGASHALVPGQAHIFATDGGGATYYVTKLTAHKVTLLNRTNTSTALITNLTAGWTLGAATGTNQVSLTNA